MIDLAQDKHFQRFARFRADHMNPGTCKLCEYRYRDYYFYLTHLRQNHPQEYEKWCDWTGVKKE